MRARELVKPLDWVSIGNDCSQALALARNRKGVLYRGMTKRLPIFQGESPTKRHPWMTSVSVQKAVDDWFAHHGFQARRGNSIFCSGDRAQASVYADANGLYAIFPFDEAAITWSKSIRDMYGEMIHLEHQMAVDIRNEHSQLGRADILDRVKAQLPKSIPGFMDKADYVSGDLATAIASRHEVMVSGRYWAVQSTLFDAAIN